MTATTTTASRSSIAALSWSNEKIAECIQRIIADKQDFPLTTLSYKLRSFDHAFTGVALVSYLNAHRIAPSRAAAVSLGRDWLSKGFIQHVALDHHFQDATHVYRFHNYNLQVCCGLTVLGTEKKKKKSTKKKKKKTSLS
jgi:hypothetical protein